MKLQRHLHNGIWHLFLNMNTKSFHNSLEELVGQFPKETPLLMARCVNEEEGEIYIGIGYPDTQYLIGHFEEFVKDLIKQHETLH